jgi:membrane-associated protease RseP (regulator of RpoE activity)
LVLHLALFLATCLTTTFTGALYANPASILGENATLASILTSLGHGVPFSASIIGILLTHEMGHYVYARYHHVDVSLPYFIPLPMGIGTLGAVIKMRGPIRSRNALVDIGAAGPLAGLAVAIPILAYGIHLSPVSKMGAGMVEGNSALYLALKWVIKGAILPGAGMDIQLHAVAWAGWVGLLVTMINLLPIGQLDGGHVAFAFFGSRQNRASLWLHRALLPLALCASAYSIWELSAVVPFETAVNKGWLAGLHWFVWWALLRLMRRMSGGEYHPPAGDEPLSPGRRRLCHFVFVVFLLIFTPIPLRRSL